MFNNAANKIPIDYKTVIPKSVKVLCIINIIISFLALILTIISFVALDKVDIYPDIKNLLDNIITFTALSSVFFWTFSLTSLFFQLKSLIYIVRYKAYNFDVLLYSPFVVSFLLMDIYIILQIVLFMTI
jgi:hypothetical protein